MSSVSGCYAVFTLSARWYMHTSRIKTIKGGIHDAIFVGVVIVAHRF